MLIINLLVVLMLRRRCCQCIANITIPGCPDLTEILEMDDREAKLAALNEIEAPFARVTYGIIRGCVGAVDGLALRVRRAPQKKLGKKARLGSMENPASLYNRKKFHALNMQAIADKKKRLRFVSIKTPGSTHDSVAWCVSKMATLMHDMKKLPTHYFIVADDAYAASEQLIVPYPGRGLPNDMDAFNFYQNSMRICVVYACLPICYLFQTNLMSTIHPTSCHMQECAFGLLVARWGFLWREMKMSLEKVPIIVQACCKLHNMCIDDSNDARSRSA